MVCLLLIKKVGILFKFRWTKRNILFYFYFYLIIWNSEGKKGINLLKDFRSKLAIYCPVVLLRKNIVGWVVLYIPLYTINWWLVKKLLKFTYYVNEYQYWRTGYKLKHFFRQTKQRLFSDYSDYSMDVLENVFVEIVSCTSDHIWRLSVNWSNFCNY